ncbi:MAG: hypothetical protein JXM74_05535 [Fusobacteriaceae bacterium]|nr:hypothetical protein [Fusobacteriaceae bacterium]MBN2838200.1 hypothetical protein [Fusobacteriaceae bacterium]
MKNKKLILVVTLSTLISIFTFGKTTITPYMEVESNAYKNGDELKDAVTLGLATVQTISDKTSLSVDIKTTDYDFIGDSDNSAGTTAAASRERIVAYINNQIFKSQKGTTLTLGLGTQLDTSTIAGSKTISYRIRPMLSYPITKNLSVTGDWLITKDKTDKTSSIGDYYSTYELLTGVKYTGIKNYTLVAQLYNYGKEDLASGKDDGETETQLRGSISTKLSGITITPWVRLDIGKYKYKKADGSEDFSKEKSRNRYGLDLSKAINNVNYATSMYIQPTNYTSSGKVDETQKYIKFAVTYSF